MAKALATIKTLLVNNWALKVLALILALITYQSIKDAISFEVPFEIPVEVDVEKGIAILDQNPRTVEVTFQGSRADLRQLSHGQMKVVLNPKATDPAGSELITITPGKRSVKTVGKILRLAIDTLQQLKQVFVVLPARPLFDIATLLVTLILAEEIQYILAYVLPVQAIKIQPRGVQ